MLDREREFYVEVRHTGRLVGVQNYNTTIHMKYDAKEICFLVDRGKRQADLSASQVGAVEVL